MPGRRRQEGEFFAADAAIVIRVGALEDGLRVGRQAALRIGATTTGGRGRDGGQELGAADDSVAILVVAVEGLLAQGAVSTLQLLVIQPAAAVSIGTVEHLGEVGSVTVLLPAPEPWRGEFRQADDAVAVAIKHGEGIWPVGGRVAGGQRGGKQEQVDGTHGVLRGDMDQHSDPT